MWRIWAYALGRKEGRNKHDADRIAIIRTLIMLQLIITNGFIIAGNVKNLWFDNDKPTRKGIRLNRKEAEQLLIILRRELE